MATASAPSPRASLLSGLRTGGVRSVSSPLGVAPRSAAPGASFNMPSFASSDNFHFHDEVADEVGDMLSYNRNAFSRGNRQAPLTAGLDGQFNNLTQQQQNLAQRGLNVNSLPFTPGMAHMPVADIQTQAFQMQLMQMEILRLQAIQAQQYQADVIAQAERQQQTLQGRTNVGYAAPASADPTKLSFGMNGQPRRASHAEQLKAQLGVRGDADYVPMTAALGGRFGGRTLNGYNKAGAESDDDLANHTTVISGGTPLGTPPVNGTASGNSVTPSKSDAATSWRRGGNNNSVLSGNKVANITVSPTVRITPPPGERVSSSPLSAGPKLRPQPLRFTPQAPSDTIAIIAVDTDSADTEDGYSSTSSKSNHSSSTPTTPHSSSSLDAPLSPREEASKKLYEGLGIGRPSPPVGTLGQAPPSPPASAVSHRLVSQPLRQPRGPPSGADELGPKNFATRIRRKAIGGLGLLMGARERREVVEAY